VPGRHLADLNSIPGFGDRGRVFMIRRIAIRRPVPCMPR
jgi:hypothetical protein